MGGGGSGSTTKMTLFAGNLLCTILLALSIQSFTGAYLS